MGHEIDFLPVGENSSGGDAIALRWGNLNDDATSMDRYVAVVDGGHADSGDLIAEHIQQRYGTSYIDLMVSTHPDNDHIRGLITLMERDDITVARLWMHKPWEHNTKAALARLTATYGKTEARTFEDYVANAKKLHELAEARDVSITEPFAGLSLECHGGSITVVGPTEEHYQSLVPGFGSRAAAPDMSRAIKALLQGTAKILTRAKEDLWTETLTDGGTTSAPNNSSAMLLLAEGGHHDLLTGDAGIYALSEAMPYIDAERAGAALSFVQLPHHGSRHNVGPTVLDQLLGPKGTSDRRGVAFCSCPKENPDARHPAKMVTNAFTRRGYPVHLTSGSTKWHHVGAPSRWDFSPSQPEPFHSEVETFED